MSIVHSEFFLFPPNTYRIVAYMLPEAEGGYSVISINLPGCCTQGETLGECVEMLKEAATLLIESYLADGQPIPWKKPDEWPPEGSQRITVFIQVSKPNP